MALVLSERATACPRCDREMERSHMFGGLRYYVCPRCKQWAVPFPPNREPDPDFSSQGR